MTTPLPVHPEVLEGERSHRASIFDRAALLLALGDLAAFLAFGALGLASHERSLSLETVARSVVPFPVAWFVIAPWFGLLSVGHGPSPDRPRLAGLLSAWLIAGVLALCARALIFDRELFNAFFVIALAGNGLFVAGWRVIYSWWQERAFD